jgi:hypothetical protein
MTMKEMVFDNSFSTDAQKALMWFKRPLEPLTLDDLLTTCTAISPSMHRRSQHPSISPYTILFHSHKMEEEPVNLRGCWVCHQNNMANQQKCRCGAGAIQIRDKHERLLQWHDARLGGPHRLGYQSALQQLQ